MRFSDIPPAQLKDLDDRDLLTAINNEGLELLGGQPTPARVATLPFGYRVVVADSAVGSQVAGDGVATTVFNDDGTEMFALAALCHSQIGCHDLAAMLREIDELHRAWRARTSRTPRSFAWRKWTALDHALALDAYEDPLLDAFAAAFKPLVAYLRADPHCRTRA